MIGNSRRAALGWLVGLVAVWSSPGAAQPYFYPMQGQSPQQEESDKGQCYAWAVQQTGFDPANPRVALPTPPPSYYGQPRTPPGGAGVGAMFGGLRRMRFEEQEQQEQMQMKQQQAYAAQQQNALAQGRAKYERAFGACMSGRGYSVR